MRTLFSEHAVSRLKERRISQEEVLQALAAPDSTDIAFGGRLVAEKTLGKRTLRVIYSEENNERTVVTVYWIGERK
jgi:hypothetical protein